MKENRQLQSDVGEWLPAGTFDLIRESQDADPNCDPDSRKDRRRVDQGAEQRREMEESKPSLLSSIFKGKKDLKTKLKHTLRRNQKIERVHHSLPIYLLTIVCMSLMGTENLYIFLWGYRNRVAYIFFPTLLIRPPFFIASSLLLCSNWRVLAKLYFCFDRIFLAGLACTLSVIVYCYFFIPLTSRPWIYYSMYGLVPLLNLSFSGYCRVMMVYCKWRAWQTILFKLSIIVGGVSYFGLGLYYTIVDGSFTGGASPRLDNIILQLLFLYAFAGFDFHIEIVSMVDDTDGTVQNKSNYRLYLEPEDMQVLLHGKVIPLEPQASNHLRLSLEEI